ncbi:MAG: hypothetical protein ACO3EE_06955 [Flavobacteriales bacterium]
MKNKEVQKKNWVSPAFYDLNVQKTKTGGFTSGTETEAGHNYSFSYAS